MNDHREHVYREAGKIFDYEIFFSYPYRQEDYNVVWNATVLITSKQAITIPNIDDYKGTHDSTQRAIIDAIYNKPKSGYWSSAEYAKLQNKAIRMRLISKNGLKLIVIYFPRKITKKQLNLLQAYQNTYGDIVGRLSEKFDKNMGDLPIVVFRDCDGDDNRCHSFENAVEFAKTLPKVKTQDTPDEIIIGQVISPYGQILHNRRTKSLESLKEEALDNGVTSEDCNSFLEKVKNLWQMIRGGR